ncbi:Zip-domain-containing protein, partial [Stipitochalara longipes BDJ]
MATISNAIANRPGAPEEISLPKYQYPALPSANGQPSSQSRVAGSSVIHTTSLQVPPSSIPLPPSRSHSVQSQDSLIKDGGKHVERGIVAENLFPQQLATFCILEFGVLFHSGIIGLNLGTNSSSELVTLLVVLIFHQSFEGLGVGARLSDIDFPKKWKWLNWFFCALYGSITSIAIAIGLGVRHSYDPGSFTANIVSGVLDSASCGILIYTGLVELLAKDFIFNQEKKSNKNLVL